HQAVRQVAPQQRGEADRHQDQRAAHGRRAGLGEVRARALLAHRLADLVRGELADHVGAENQRHRERGEAGEHRAQRDVVEHVEQPEILGEPLRKLEQHQCPPSAVPVSAATTRSIFMKREPFTRMVLLFKLATSSSTLSKWRASAPKARTVSRVASPMARSCVTPLARAYSPTSRWNSLPRSPTSPMSP